MDKVNLSEGKEVEVVSSRNRKKGVNGKKKLNISKLFKFKKKETTTSKEIVLRVKLELKLKILEVEMVALLKRRRVF